MQNPISLVDEATDKGAFALATSTRAGTASPSQRGSIRRYALTEKLRIVQEASQAGVKLAHIERKYGLGKNVLAYWRKVYRDLSQSQIRAEQAAAPANEELAALRVQVRQLERLLGRKTLEVELLKRQLAGDT